MAGVITTVELKDGTYRGTMRGEMPDGEGTLEIKGHESRIFTP